MTKKTRSELDVFWIFGECYQQGYKRSLFARSDFGLISFEIGNKDATNLDIATVEISDKYFRSFL